MDPNMTPLNTQQDPTSILQQLLLQIQARQGQPIVPDNPMAQMGTVLGGFAAGVQGRPNPVLAQFQQQRKDELSGLHEQAGIAGSLATIENAKATREMDRQKFLLATAKDMENSDVYEERVNALRVKQSLGMLPKEIPIEKMAAMKGKDYEAKWDQALTIMQQGENPFDPAKFGTQFDPSLFPVQTFQQAAMGGPNQLEALKKKPHQPTEGALKAEFVYLGGLTKRTPEQERKYEELRKVVAKETNQSAVLSMMKMLQAEDVAKGLPPKDGSAYLEMAHHRLDRSESFEKDMDDEATRKGLTGEARFAWKREQRESYAKSVAEIKSGATPVPIEIQNKLTIMRDAKRTLTRIATEFSPQERARYAGWLNFTGAQLKQAVAADPKFATFQTLIRRAQSDMAFSDGGKQLTGIERDITFGWVPTGKELSVADFEAKLRESYNRIDTTMEDALSLAVNPKSILKTGPQPPPLPTTPGGIQFRIETGPDGKKRVIPNG